MEKRLNRKKAVRRGWEDARQSPTLAHHLAIFEICKGASINETLKISWKSASAVLIGSSLAGWRLWAASVWWLSLSHAGCQHWEGNALFIRPQSPSKISAVVRALPIIYVATDTFVGFWESDELAHRSTERTVAGLALFGIASPNLYRTKLWQVGSDYGFNSSPNQALYAYANYQPAPKTAFVWSSTLTQFNLAISVLSMFVLLVKATMFILHVWYPLLGTATNLAITVLWAVSVYGQAGPDHSDPQHPSNVAWYISKSCSYAKADGWEHYCLQAKGAFATTVIMMAIFFFNMLLGVWSLIPSAAERAANKLGTDEMQMDTSPVSENNKEWEMTAPLPSAKQPYTPRTLAFHTLDRQLPLRSQGGR
ncbi:hypothetical protein B7463_g3088, partial [Scytalidium lignicola]